MLTVSDINVAEICLIKSDQQDYLPKVYSYFNLNYGKLPNLVHQLRLFSSHGVIRSAGRIKHSHMTECSKYPIVLSPESPLARLLVHDIHVKNCHAGLTFFAGEVVD